jgi:hypothetical protein
MRTTGEKVGRGMLKLELECACVVKDVAVLKTLEEV